MFINVLVFSIAAAEKMRILLLQKSRYFC